MGLISSKSPLERRNTVLKRSQRKTIHTIKCRIEKLFQDIKKFRGTEEDEKYKVLLTEIGQLENELKIKIRDLQPQVRNIHQVTVARLEEAAQTLQSKVIENREKLEKKSEEKRNHPDNDDEQENVPDNHIAVEDNTLIQSTEHLEESDSLETSTNKRKTVELKFLQFEPDASVKVDVHQDEAPTSLKSPNDKRKSILKMGVPVMPGAMLEEISKKTNQMSVHYDPKVPVENSETLVSKLGEIVEQIQNIEFQIADFVGKKHGTQYNRIKDKLDGFMHEVTLIKTADEFVVDQIQQCTNYIGSCLRFLDDKALENKEAELQDDVFLPVDKNKAINEYDAQTKLQRLTKTTAI